MTVQAEILRDLAGKVEFLAKQQAEILALLKGQTGHQEEQAVDDLARDIQRNGFAALSEHNRRARR